MIAGSAFLLGGCNGSTPAPTVAPSATATPTGTVLSSTLTITSANNGQTFDNYTISTTSGPCVIMQGASNVTIEDFKVGPCGTNNSTNDSTGIEIIGGSGDNIVDSYIHVENLSSDGGDDHEGVLISGASGIIVQGNVFAFNETSVEINSGTSSGDVINGNMSINPRGPYPRGQHFQTGDNTSNLTIENNRELSCQQSGTACAHAGDVFCLACNASTLAGDSFTYYADQEDANNIFGTSGFAITNNWIEGGDSPTGQGILIDTGSSTGTITNNILKDTGHGCIGPYGAGTTSLTGNKCESLTAIDDKQSGIYLYNPFSISGTISTANNTISCLYGPSSGFGTCDPATSACEFNSYGDALSGKLTLDDEGGNVYDDYYPAAVGGGTGYLALNPIATTNPPPLIPPLPKNCVANSPYSTQTSLPLCS